MLRVEVLPSEAGRRERSVVISNGTDANVVKTVSVGSLQQLMRLLSESNVALLDVIRVAHPRSVAELARLTGRPKASLMQTLRRLERFGLVTFRSTTGRRKMPEIVCDTVRLDMVLAGGREGTAPVKGHGHHNGSGNGNGSGAG